MTRARRKLGPVQQAIVDDLAKGPATIAEIMKRNPTVARRFQSFYVAMAVLLRREVVVRCRPWANSRKRGSVAARFRLQRKNLVAELDELNDLRDQLDAARESVALLVEELTREREAHRRTREKAERSINRLTELRREDDAVPYNARFAG